MDRFDGYHSQIQPVCFSHILTSKDKALMHPSTKAAMHLPSTQQISVSSAFVPASNHEIKRQLYKNIRAAQ
jgi:hypothetical protein